VKALVIFLFSVCFWSIGSAQSYDIKPLSVNTKDAEYAPFVFESQLYFTSNRKTKTIEPYRDANGDSPSKINVATIGPDGGVDKPIYVLTEPIATVRNEGTACISADGKTMYYTGTIPSGNRNKVGNTGIFITQKTGTQWGEPVAFAHNSSDHSFNTAHPYLSNDGKILLFASNKPGGKGGNDIYQCQLVNGTWTQPQPLEHVNTPADEIMPFLLNGNELFFSSNRTGGLGGFDLYSVSHQTSTNSPKALEAPFNSTFDDFSIYFYSDKSKGFLASNRSGNDDLYEVNFLFPTFADCGENTQLELCYFIEETKIEQVDSLPFVYEWDFGDGTRARGLANDHCFPGPGSYSIVLNINDTITKSVYAKVSNYTLDLQKSNAPFIIAPDSVGIEEEVEFRASSEEFTTFKPARFFWYFSDGLRYSGENCKRSFSEEGLYSVTLGALDLSGETEIKSCVTKLLQVGKTTLESQLALTSLVENTTAVSEEQTEISNEDTESVFYVEFAKSLEPIPLTDTYFEKVEYEITERFDKDDEIYRYTVGETANALQLYNLYKELRDLGYKQSIVREEVIETKETETLQKGWYLPDSLRKAINSHLKKFSSIQFAYNKTSIDPSSHANLDYITSVLQKQNELGLQITAFTDDIGSEIHNQRISQERAKAVVNYLVSKGIDKKRLVAIGKGELNPIADNSTEEGRAKNRRVEFEILAPSE
jgi:outer membrane protein OmpA-like peptidoglycan-associated protein